MVSAVDLPRYRGHDDFSALISNPKLMLIGAAAQFGIFGAYIIALQMGFEPNQAGAIGIIGGADGPTAIFLSSKLAPNLMGLLLQYQHTLIWRWFLLSSLRSCAC